jgi:hypothetical protein
MSRPLRIRGGSGLGDSIYVRPIAEHYVRQGHAVSVCTNYPDVFIGSGASVEPFSRKADITAHYAHRKFEPATNQWQDVCIAAKVDPALRLTFAWAVRNHGLTADVRAKAAGRPLILVLGGRKPMGRPDNFGAELLPDKRAFDAALDALDGCYTVRIGSGTDLGGRNDEKYRVATDCDLVGKTTVSDLIDLAHVCDGWLAQCSLAIPLAESFGKPILCVWASKGLTAKHRFISAITPKKVFSAPTSRFVVDSYPDEMIAERVRETFALPELEAA